MIWSFNQTFRFLMWAWGREKKTFDGAFSELYEKWESFVGGFCFNQLETFQIRRKTTARTSIKFIKFWNSIGSLYQTSFSLFSISTIKSSPQLNFMLNIWRSIIHTCSASTTLARLLSVFSSCQTRQSFKSHF